MVKPNETIWSISVNIAEEISEPNDSDNDIDLLNDMENIDENMQSLSEPNDSDCEIQLVCDTTIYINNLTMEPTNIEPVEILQLESKPWMICYWFLQSISTYSAIWWNAIGKYGQF